MNDESDLVISDSSNPGRGFLQNVYLMLFLATVVAVAAYVSARHFDFPKSSYTSFTDIRIIPTGAELSYARSALGGSRDAQSTALVQTFAETLTSDRVVQAALERVATITEDDKEETSPPPETSGTDRFKGYLSRAANQLNYGEVTTQPADELSRIRRSITVDNIKGSFVVRVSVKMKKPQRAAAFASALVDAYTDILNDENTGAQNRIRASYRARLVEMDAELSSIIADELELREKLGAVDLEARLLTLNRSIDDISAVIIPLQVQLESHRNVDPNDSGLKSLQQKVASLEATMADMIAERKLITKMEFELRANWKRQESIAEAITEVRNALYSPALDREHGIVNINVLRTPKVPVVPDPPTPLQVAVISWFGFLVLAFCVAVAVTLFENVTRPYD